MSIPALPGKKAIDQGCSSPSSSVSVVTFRATGGLSPGDIEVVCACAVATWKPPAITVAINILARVLRASRHLVCRKANDEGADGERDVAGGTAGVILGSLAGCQWGRRLASDMDRRGADACLSDRQLKMTTG